MFKIQLESKLMDLHLTILLCVTLRNQMVDFRWISPLTVLGAPFINILGLWHHV